MISSKRQQFNMILISGSKKVPKSRLITSCVYIIIDSEKQFLDDLVIVEIFNSLINIVHKWNQHLPKFYLPLMLNQTIFNI